MIPVLVMVLAAASDPAANGSGPSPSARAQTGAVSLVFGRGAGAESCPGEDDLRAAVAARLGFDPFRPGGEREIRCTVRRSDGAFRARIEVAPAGSPAIAGRDLISYRDDCGELAEAVTLTIGIAINPLIAAPPAETTSRPPAPEPVAAPAAPVSAPALPPPAAPPAATTVARAVAPQQRAATTDLRFGAHVAATVGVGPRAAPAVGLDAQLRRRALSLVVDARVVAQSSVAAGAGSATAWLWSASVGPCFHRDLLALCAVGTAGQLRAAGNGYATVADSTAPYLAVGARGVVELPLGDRLRLLWTGEVAAPLVTVHLTVDGRDVWASPRVNALSSLGLGMAFQ
jgi:hypothetical protein